MSDYQDMITAFQIFDKYDHRGLIHAECNVLYAGPDSGIVSVEDTKKLESLGWVADEYGSFQKYC